MRVLVLGGTQFLGRHVVTDALACGHTVTLFNRGTRPQLFPDVEKLVGDRDGDLTALKGKSFDAVVDTSGFVPRLVRATLDALDEIGHYTFVSTMSVYADDARRLGEDAPVLLLDEETEEIRRDTYGPLKALCEQVVRARFPRSSFILRPGLIVGPWDPTGRFTYWPLRFLRPGPILAPAPATAPVQLIDARDLAAWIVEAAVGGTFGTYNAVSQPTPMREVLQTCHSVAGSDAEIVWVDGNFLVAHGVQPWGELPLWVGPDDPDVMRAPVQRARSAGLHTRPLRQTVQDTVDWAREQPGAEQTGAGLDPDKETRILRAWTNRTSPPNGAGRSG